MEIIDITDREQKNQGYTWEETKSGKQVRYSIIPGEISVDDALIRKIDKNKYEIGVVQKGNKNIIIGIDENIDSAKEHVTKYYFNKLLKQNIFSAVQQIESKQSNQPLTVKDDTRKQIMGIDAIAAETKVKEPLEKLIGEKVVVEGRTWEDLKNPVIEKSKDMKINIDDIITEAQKRYAVEFSSIITSDLKAYLQNGLLPPDSIMKIVGATVQEQEKLNYTWEEDKAILGKPMYRYAIEPGKLSIGDTLILENPKKDKEYAALIVLKDFRKRFLSQDTNVDSLKNTVEKHYFNTFLRLKINGALKEYEQIQAGAVLSVPEAPKPEMTVNDIATETQKRYAVAIQPILLDDIDNRLQQGKFTADSVLAMVDRTVAAIGKNGRARMGNTKRIL